MKKNDIPPSFASGGMGFPPLGPPDLASGHPSVLLLLEWCSLLTWVLSSCLFWREFYELCRLICEASEENDQGNMISCYGGGVYQHLVLNARLTIVRYVAVNLFSFLPVSLVKILGCCYWTKWMYSCKLAAVSCASEPAKWSIEAWTFRTFMCE